MATTTNLDSLVINYLTQEQYDEAQQAGTLNANQLYLTPDTGNTYGTVTSIGIANATNGGLSISGSPITSDGTITIGLASAYGDTKNPYGNKTANYVLAGPSSGSAAAPSFRALVAADIPDLSGTYSTTDEKLKTTTISSNGQYYPLVGDATYTAGTKYYSGNFRYSKSTGIDSLQLGQVSSSSTSKGRLTLCSGPYYTYLDPPLYSTISASQTYTLPASSGTIALTSDIPTKTSDLTNDSGFVTTDEKVKRTTYTSTNPLYPILHTDKTGTSAAYTSDISFYQYYNTAGGYRRLDLGNSTAYKSTGGAYGTIRLYGAAATYYGDLVPGVLGTTSGDGHISANRTWTLPDKTGTIALTSDIPDVSGFITTDEKVKQTEKNDSYNRTILLGSDTTSDVTSGVEKTANLRYNDNGNIELLVGPISGNYAAYRSTGIVFNKPYPYELEIPTGLTNKKITFPSATGTIALTSDIPSVYSSTNTGGYLTMATLPIYNGTVV